MSDAAEKVALDECLARESCIPVMLDAKLIDLYYNGFCNSVLWSLFHYVPLNTDSRLSETRTLEFQWIAYQDANRRYVTNSLQEPEGYAAELWHLDLPAWERGKEARGSKLLHGFRTLKAGQGHRECMHVPCTRPAQDRRAAGSLI